MAVQSIDHLVKRIPGNPAGSHEHHPDRRFKDHRTRHILKRILTDQTADLPVDQTAKQRSLQIRNGRIPVIWIDLVFCIR